MDFKRLSLFKRKKTECRYEGGSPGTASTFFCFVCRTYHTLPNEKWHVITAGDFVMMACEESLVDKQTDGTENG